MPAEAESPGIGHPTASQLGILTAMSNVLRLAIVDPTDSTRDALKSLLLGMDMIWLEAECSRYEFFSDVIAQTHPDIGLVSLDANPDKAVELIASIGETSPDCAVLAVSSSSDGQADTAGDARGGQGIPHPAHPDRRPPQRAGTH